MPTTKRKKKNINKEPAEIAKASDDQDCNAAKTTATMSEASSSSDPQLPLTLEQVHARQQEQPLLAPSTCSSQQQQNFEHDFFGDAMCEHMGYAGTTADALPWMPEQSHLPQQEQPISAPMAAATQQQGNAEQHFFLPARVHPIAVDDVLEEKYEALEKIGEGVFGEVYKGVHRATRRDVAVKKIRAEDAEIQYECQGVPAQIIREVSCLRHLVHPNVVELLDVHICGMSHYILVFEYVRGGDLHKMLKSLRSERRRMDINLVRKFSLDLLSGIHACHARLIIHRDLKPQNILVGSHGLKIADFGLSRAFSLPVRDYTIDVITLWYRAPEILLGCQQYGPEVDMWSAGCILAEMAKGSAIFNGDSEIDTLFKIFRQCGTPSESTWPAVANLAHWKPCFPKWPPTNLEAISERCPELGEESMELIRNLLALVPSNRFSARNAKRHAADCIQHSSNASNM